MAEKRVTIEELEKILASHDELVRIEILPNGEVRGVKRDEPVEIGPVQIHKLQDVASSY